MAGDQRRLVQLLRTLLGHAKAHADGGLPSVRVFLEGDRLVVEVTAAGGPPGDADLLEVPVPDREGDSLGLRLLVARAIAEAHGGGQEAGDAAGRLQLRCWLPVAG